MSEARSDIRLMPGLPTKRCTKKSVRTGSSCALPQKGRLTRSEPSASSGRRSRQPRESNRSNIAWYGCFQAVLQGVKKSSGHSKSWPGPKESSCRSPSITIDALPVRVGVPRLLKAGACTAGMSAGCVDGEWNAGMSAGCADIAWTAGINAGLADTAWTLGMIAGFADAA